MQIHEVTQPVNEILGAITKPLGLAYNLAKGVAGAAKDEYLQKYGDITPDTKGPPGGRPEAFKANAQLVGALGKQLNKAWSQYLQQFLARTRDTAGNPATNLAAVSPGSLAQLKPQLINMINSAISPRGQVDYSQLENSVADDPVAQGQARAARAALDRAVDAIIDATMKPGNNAQQLARAWADAVQNGIAPAQDALAFTPGSGARSRTTSTSTSSGIKITQDPRGGWLVNGEPMNQALRRPGVQQALDDMIRNRGL